MTARLFFIIINYRVAGTSRGDSALSPCGAACAGVAASSCRGAAERESAGWRPGRRAAVVVVAAPRGRPRRSGRRRPPRRSGRRRPADGVDEADASVDVLRHDVAAEHEYDLQSPVEADRTTCRDPAGPGPQTSPRGPGSRTAGLPGTNGVESPGDQARAWSQCREVLFQRRFSLDPLTGGADGLARVICALSHSPHRRPRPVDRPTAHSGDLLDR